MKSRVEKYARCEAIKLRDDAILKLKEQNCNLKKEICDLREELMIVNSRLVREMNINDSLVKHSHILFEQLSKIKNKDCVLRKRVEAFKPTADDLESFFNGR